MLDLAHVGALGHTVGAGVLVLSAAKDPRLKTLVLAAPIDTMPSSIAAAKEIRVPISLIVAKDDWLAAPDAGAVPIYRAAPPPKQLHVLTGGSSNAYFYDGEGPDRTKQLRVFRHLATTFLLLYLRRDTAAWACTWGDDMLNNTKVWSIADRGVPSSLTRRSPVASAIEQLQEEVFSQPTLPQTIGKDFAPPGPYAVGYTNVSRLTRSSELFLAAVWYPAERQGVDTPLVVADAPYPLVVFAHGWFHSAENYLTMLAHLASHGYVVIGSRSNNELFADKYATALSWCVDFLCDQSAINGSRWFGVIDPERVGMLGHSIGASAAALAAATDVRVRALALLSPVETHPSPVSAIEKCHVPVLLLASPEDIAQGLKGVTSPMYDAVAPPKQLHLLHNGSSQFFPDGMLLGHRHRRQLKDTQLTLLGFFDTYLHDAKLSLAPPPKPGAAGATGVGAAGGGAAGGAPSRVPWSHELWGGGTLPRRSRTVLHDRGFTAELLPHADSANATNGSGSEEAHAGLQGDRCTWRVRVNNSGRERTQIDIAVGGNAWAVTAPERTPVLRSSASWTFEVVEELPTARRLTVDAFTVRLCARLDGVTCAALRLVCRCERLPTRVVIDEHGWTA